MQGISSLAAYFAEGCGVSNRKPIADAPRNGTRIILGTDYPKARYPIVIGKWNVKFNEWQSDPGGWPIKPQWWVSLDDI